MPAKRSPGAPKRTASPRRGGQPRVLPGMAEVPPSENPEFLKWQQQYNPVGTWPEYLVFRWLEQKKGYVHGLDFRYLAVVGGARRFAGVQIDFLVQNWLALAVDGIYFHFSKPEQRESGALARATAQSAGYIFVSILDLDIVNNIDSAMTLALVGAEMPGAPYGRALNG